MLPIDPFAQSALSAFKQSVAPVQSVDPMAPRSPSGYPSSSSSYISGDLPEEIPGISSSFDPDTETEEEFIKRAMQDELGRILSSFGSQSPSSSEGLFSSVTDVFDG